MFFKPAFPSGPPAFSFTANLFLGINYHRSNPGVEFSGLENHSSDR
jgi:hypothetical protein